MQRTNIDQLGERYGRLMNVELERPFTLALTEKFFIYQVKAFMAEGGQQRYEDRTYYTQVENTLVLDFSVEVTVPSNAANDYFCFFAHHEEGYVVDYPSTFRNTDMWPEWYKRLSMLMSAVEAYLSNKG